MTLFAKELAALYTELLSALELAVVEGVAVPDMVVLPPFALRPGVMAPLFSDVEVDVVVGTEDNAADGSERRTALPLFALAFLLCFSVESSRGFVACLFLEPLRC